ncbi:hypothetical protein [Chakrabartyella piscis]|uniref:hypothetical protein n=1 Tax=Chakrabartyella piscis TaxID=2918914 RepID=UPI0029584CD5|nr:hypothetical protein [Chakrabartyella piscis]
MSFEAEVIPLFIGGIIIVSILEVFFGIIVLNDRKQARNNLIGHAVSMLLGFVFLVRSMFANWLNVFFDIPSISNSASIGLFGLCWAISIAFFIQTILCCLNNN